MSKTLTDLRNALEQARGWLDDAIECAGRGDKGGAAENADDALPWLKTAYRLADQITGGSGLAELLREAEGRVKELKAAPEAEALAAVRSSLDVELPEGVDGDEEDDEGAEVEEAAHVSV